MGFMYGCTRRGCNKTTRCSDCETRYAAVLRGETDPYEVAKRKGGRGRNSSRNTSFRDKPQRNDPSITNTFFNSGKVDGDNHGHVKYRNNPDGTTTYFYARDENGTEYDV